MKINKYLLPLLLLAAFASTNAQPSPPRVTVFENVNVIPMDRERVLKNQTVVVRDGLIAEVGDARKVKAPAGAVRVDGRGKYLVPGLVDMHTHLFSDDDFPDELAGDELTLMLANGVTTVRLMIGTPEHLSLRGKIARGELLAPTLYVASPQLTGNARYAESNGRHVATPEDARRAVRDFKAAGYDFIKITNFITRPVYDAATETAKEVGIRIVGHVDTQVGVARALEAGQQIEHLDAYLESVLKDDSPIKTSVSDIGLFKKENWVSLDHIDERKIKEIARATARAGVYSTPTLTFFKITYGTGATDEEIRARPDYRFAPPHKRERWERVSKRLRQDPPSEARRREYVRVRNLLVKEIHAAGGKIMAGSDTPEWYLLYGWTLHRELRSLVEAGLSPYAALEAATRNPAEYLKATDHIGTVARGKRADLVLLEANPLDSIANTERRAGVMSRGRWLPEAELRTMLDAVAVRFEKTAATAK
ncbi:MAG TPA: amidohydrolase family protein [Pyrinomonadaceae bacterium]|nr:amidohydrolase family protein [Pyrinomonadaceae bacterium]